MCTGAPLQAADAQRSRSGVSKAALSTVDAQQLDGAAYYQLR
jgi:hypothetical protein